MILRDHGNYKESLEEILCDPYPSLTMDTVVWVSQELNPVILVSPIKHLPLPDPVADLSPKCPNGIMPP